MKKLLGIVVLGLLLGGNVYAKTINDFIKTGMTKKQLTKVTEKLFSPYYKTPIMKKLGHTGSLFDMRKCPFHEYYPKFKTEILRHSKINSDGSPMYVFENVTEPSECRNLKNKIGSGTLKALVFSNDEARLIADPTYQKKLKKKEEQKQRAEAKASGDLTFTIKDKKEQCTAIGFAPATEKFADCVLRLVELDVKTQQTNQIALAQSQGNQQIADQLKKQRSDQSSQYFLDLSQKLLNPQSTVSAPSTSTCTISGGVYKNITCW